MLYTNQKRGVPTIIIILNGMFLSDPQIKLQRDIWREEIMDMFPWTILI